MKGKRLVLLAVLMLSTLLLAACSGGGSSNIQGKWIPPDTSEVSDFLPNATLEQIRVEFTKDGKIVTTVDGKPLADAALAALKATGLTDEQAKAQLGTFPETSYQVSGSVLTMNTKLLDEQMSIDFTYKIQGDKLSLTAYGITQEYTRAK